MKRDIVKRYLGIGISFLVLIRLFGCASGGESLNDAAPSVYPEDGSTPPNVINQPQMERKPLIIGESLNDAAPSVYPEDGRSENMRVLLPDDINPYMESRPYIEAGTYGADGRPDWRSRVYLDGRDMQIDGDDKASIGTTYYLIGREYADEGDWDKALVYFQQSSEQIEIDGGDKAFLGSIYHNIGMMYSYKGDWDKALEYYQKNEQILIEVSDKAGLGTIYNTIGKVYADKGDWDKALEYFQQSEQILIDGGDKAFLGWIYHNIGMMYSKKGDWDQSLEYFQQSEQIFIEVSDKAGLGSTYLNMAAVYYEQGDSRAIDYIDRSVAIFTELGMQYGLSQAKERQEDIYHKFK